MRYRKLLFVVLMLVLVIGQAQGAFAQGRKDPAPLLSTDSETAIPGEYIVVFEPGAAGAQVDAAMEHAQRAGGNVHYRYTEALNGFAASLPEQALNGIRHNPNVLFIEADQWVFADSTQSPATWGIDRIDQRALPLSNSYTYNFTGAGVTAYIIDTGILFSHNEFGGRASSGWDFVNNDSDATDCNGHGTHVAGTVG